MHSTQRRWTWRSSLIAGISLIALAQPVAALITRLTPLREVLAGEQLILLARVEKLDPDKPAVVLQVSEDLKGKAPFRKLPVNLTGDSEGQREQHTAKLLKRLAPELPVIVFASQRGKRYTAFGYTNGTWFQVIGQAVDDPATVRWSLTHCEPYLRRTFKGTTAELRQVIVEGLAGKKQPPEPDGKEPPGLGPEVDAKQTRLEESDPNEPSRTAGINPAAPWGLARPSRGGQPLFAVIPTFVLVGPIALLAALFPAVFGGLALWLRRWLVLLSVASLLSTLFLLHSWFHGSIKDYWWSSPTVLWASMAMITLWGAVWSSRRYQAAVKAGHAEAMQPRRLDEIVLWTLSVIGIGVFLYSLVAGLALNPPWRDLLPIWIVAWAGTLYLLYLRFARRPAAAGGRTMPAEVLMLLTLAFACAGLGATAIPERSAARVAWTFEAPESGIISSSPLAAGDRIYVGAALSSGLTPFGMLYCLDETTGKPVWTFDDDGDMKQVFSSPCLADGKLYVGEGFHQDADCKLYCLDAASGRKLWQFQTKSHTESSPCVVSGKVFFGAGDDGVFCLDAATGKELWHFAGLHVDTSPAVVGQYLYGGSGYGTYEVFCLDTETGQPRWRMPVELPAFASPVVQGQHVYFGIGNGDLIKSADQPAGALLCLEAQTGKQGWRFDVPDAVHAQPAVDDQHVYIGARDHQCYCLDRADGRVVWTQYLGSPVVAAPALLGHTLYVLGNAGRVAALDTATGKVLWTVDMGQQTQTRPQLFSSPAVSRGRDDQGMRRRVYFGAGLQSVLNCEATVICLEDRE